MPDYYSRYIDLRAVFGGGSEQTLAESMAKHGLAASANALEFMCPIDDLQLALEHAIQSNLVQPQHHEHVQLQLIPAVM